MKRYNGKFMFGFKGKVVPAFMEQMIVRRRIGGVILFSRNIENIDQLRALCEELQLMRNSVSEYPLFIAVDQEGGPVNRVVDGATVFPSPMAIAATGNPDYAERVGKCMASELLSLGINMNMAPVLDLCANRNNPAIGVRSFGDDPERVGEFGAAMIHGMQGRGLISVAKHFPGLGYSPDDPHLRLPVIPKEVGEMEKEDLVPFRKAIEAGVDGIMIGHAHYPSISQRPACLSEMVMNGLLREKLGFQGLSVTDDLEMKSIAERRRVGDSVVKACKAGADIFLVCHSTSQQLDALTDLSVAIKGGRLRSRHLKAGIKRIRAVKERLRERAAHQGEEPVEDGEGLALEVAEAGLTLVGGSYGVLPLRIGPDQKIVVLCPLWERLSEVEAGNGSPDEFMKAVIERHAAAELLSFELTPSRRNFSDAARAVAGADAVIMGTCDAYRDEEQARLVNEVAAAGKPTVFIAMRNPYDAELYPDSAARLLTYGVNSHMMVAAARAIFGEIAPRGTLPVRLKL